MSGSLSETQKLELCSVVQFGCDRTTARNYVSVTSAALREALKEDDRFRRDLVRAEASVEIRHMQAVYTAAKDPKNWRASVWWLERRSPERFARRDPNSVTREQMDDAVRAMGEVIAAEVIDPIARQRIVERLAAAASDAILREVMADDPPSAADVPALEDFSEDEGDDPAEHDVEEL